MFYNLRHVITRRSKQEADAIVKRRIEGSQLKDQRFFLMLGSRNFPQREEGVQDPSCKAFIQAKLNRV